MSTKPTQGSRKLQHAREMGLILLVAFIISVCMKAPGELFAGFVTALSAISGAFVWGNVKVHSNKPPAS